MDYTVLIFLIGRILLGGYFIMGGVNHFMKMDMTKGYAQSKGVPMPGVAVGVGGLLLLAGGIGILLGVYVTCAVAAIVIFLVFVTPMMHKFWGVTDPMAQMAERVNFMKNIGLLGATLMLLAIPLPWAISLF